MKISFIILTNYTCIQRHGCRDYRGERHTEPPRCSDLIISAMQVKQNRLARHAQDTRTRRLYSSRARRTEKAARTHTAWAKPPAKSWPPVWPRAAAPRRSEAQHLNREAAPEGKQNGRRTSRTPGWPPAAPSPPPPRGLPSPPRRVPVPAPAGPPRTAGPSAATASPAPGTGRNGTASSARGCRALLHRKERYRRPRSPPASLPPRPKAPPVADPTCGLRSAVPSRSRRAPPHPPPTRRSAAAQVRRELRAAATPLRLQHPLCSLSAASDSPRAVSLAPRLLPRGSGGGSSSARHDGAGSSRRQMHYCGHKQCG